MGMRVITGIAEIVAALRQILPHTKTSNEPPSRIMCNVSMRQCLITEIFAAPRQILPHTKTSNEPPSRIMSNMSMRQCFITEIFAAPRQILHHTITCESRNGCLTQNPYRDESCTTCDCVLSLRSGLHHDKSFDT